MIGDTCCATNNHKPHTWSDQTGKKRIRDESKCCCGTVTFTKMANVNLPPRGYDDIRKMNDPKVFAIPVNGEQSVRVEVGNREYSIPDAVTQVRIDMNHAGGSDITVTFKGKVTSKSVHDNPHFNPRTRHDGNYCVCRCSACYFGDPDGVNGTCKCGNCDCHLSSDAGG